MTITKKKLVVLISVFLIMFVFSSLVIAQSFNDNSDRPFVDNTDYTKLDACVINCKEVVCANEGEECRSKCIRKLCVNHQFISVDIPSPLDHLSPDVGDK